MQLTTGEYAISKEAPFFRVWPKTFPVGTELGGELVAVSWAWVSIWLSGYPLGIKNSIGKPGISAFFRYRSVPKICLWSAVLNMASLWWEGYLSSFMRSLCHAVLEAADCLLKNEIGSGSSCDGSTGFCHQEYRGFVFWKWLLLEMRARKVAAQSCLLLGSLYWIRRKEKGLGRGGDVWSWVLCYNFTFGDPDFLLTNLKKLFIPFFKK